MKKHEISDIKSHFQDLPEEGIQRLVDRLNLLKEGELAVADLVACGKRAVEPLRRFLLHGKPSGIFRPRQRAVETLAELGAKDVLIEYLSCEKEIPDPVDRYGEEAVVNTAARLLAAWREEESSHVLLRLLRKQAMPGVIEALGEFRSTEAIPDFITALGDSISGPFAEEALRKTGETAHRALLEAALTPQPSADFETPSSLYRRRSALRLLAELKLAQAEWRILSPLTDDRDLEIAARASRIALVVAEEKSREVAVQRLIDKLSEAPWFLRMEIESWLLEQSGKRQ